MTQAQGNQRTKNARTARGLEVSRVAASKKFGRYKKEEEKAVRKAEVVESQGLKRIKNAFSSFLAIPRIPRGEDYQKALSTLEGLSYSARDVETFSIAIIEFQEEHDFFPLLAGFFLSALINNCKDEDFIVHTLHLVHLEEYIRFFGYKNTKNVTVKGSVENGMGMFMKGGRIVVEGDAGAGVGDRMEGGQIIVEGDIGNSLGAQMKGGTIIVNGNADEAVGHTMEGGTIIVKGNANEAVGPWMKGGEIHLEGDYKSISDDIEGGKIYHKGKLIVDK